MKHYGKLLHINTLIIFRADKNKVSYSLEHRISQDLKGCFRHFTKWQTHPLKSKEMIGKCVKQILPCSPGQSPSSQDPVLVLDPLQGSPPPSGLGSSHSLVRDREPDPHVREQLPQLPQWPQSPSTVKTIRAQYKQMCYVSVIRQKCLKSVQQTLSLVLF